MRKGGKFILSILIPIEIYTSRTWITFRKLYELDRRKWSLVFYRVLLVKFGKFTACHVFSRQYDGRSLSLSLFPVFRRKNEARGNASRKCCMTGDMIRIWNESTRCKREERRRRRLDLSMVIPIDEILPRFFAKVVNLTCVTITREFRKTEEYRTRGLLHRGLHLPRRRPLY